MIRRNGPSEELVPHIKIKDALDRIERESPPSETFVLKNDIRLVPLEQNSKWGAIVTSRLGDQDVSGGDGTSAT